MRKAIIGERGIFDFDKSWRWAFIERAKWKLRGKGFSRMLGSRSKLRVTGFEYDSYGDNLSQVVSTGQSHKYTGQELDDEAGERRM